MADTCHSRVSKSLTWINQSLLVKPLVSVPMPPRIVTVTLNPALDLAADADEVVPTHKIRMHHEHADPGGGGVNVARVLQELGGDVVAIVAAGGATGRVFEEMLDEAQVRRRSVLVRGQTRVSLNVQDRQARAGISLRPARPDVQ